MRFLLILTLFISSIFANELNLANSYEKALEIAQKEKKRIFVMLTSENCGYCVRFEKNVLSKEAVIKALNENFVSVLIDVEKSNPPAHLDNLGTPTFYFLNNKGQKLHRTVGYQNADIFLGQIGRAMMME